MNNQALSVKRLNRLGLAVATTLGLALATTTGAAPAPHSDDAQVHTPRDMAQQAVPISQSQDTGIKPELEPSVVGPQITFESTTHTAGDLYSKTPVVGQFRFTNTGSEPLVITEVRPSCGCTTTKPTKTEYLPGESDVIEATLKIRRDGLNQSSIFVSTNDPKQPRVTLRISGKFVAPVSAEPANLPLGLVRAGEHTSEMLISSRTGTGFELLSHSVRGNNNDLDITIEQVKKDPESESAILDHAKVTVAINENAKPGLINRVIEYKVGYTDAQGAYQTSTIITTLTGTVRGELATTPPLLRLRPKADLPSTFAGTFEVYTLNGKAFDINALETTVQNNVGVFTVTAEPVIVEEEGEQPQAASRYVVTVEGTVSDSFVGAVRGEVSIATTMQNEPHKLQFNALARAGRSGTTAAATKAKAD